MIQRHRVVNGWEIDVHSAAGEGIQSEQRVSTRGKRTTGSWVLVV